MLVDFYAEWCGPCRALAPIIDELAEEYKGRPIKIGKLNIDEGADIAAKFDVMSVPTVLIFKKGKIVAHFTGIQSKKTLVEAIEKALE